MYGGAAEKFFIPRTDSVGRLANINAVKQRGFERNFEFRDYDAVVPRERIRFAVLTLIWPSTLADT